MPMMTQTMGADELRFFDTAEPSPSVDRFDDTRFDEPVACGAGVPIYNIHVQQTRIFVVYWL